MDFRFFRAIALVALLSGSLLWPVRVSADQPTVVLLTLVDGTACRGPITGTTFNLVDARANYACTDGRWIMGEPYTLGDGRQVAMLSRTILQGQRASDGADPCQQPTCVVGLGLAEVSTSATLPRLIKVFTSGSVADCPFQDNETFYLGTMRANYLCQADPWIRGSAERPDLEHWIVGGPFAFQNNENRVLIVTLLRRAAYTSADQGVCGEAPICVRQVEPYVVAPQL